MSKLLIFLFFLLNILNVVDLFSTFLGITKFGYSFESNQNIIILIKNYGWIGCSLIKVLGILFGTLGILYITNRVNKKGVWIYEKVVIVTFYILCVIYIMVLFVNFTVLGYI